MEDKLCHCVPEGRHKRTPRSEEELRRLRNRLNRMVGQLNGIRRMLDENRYCGDILIQIAAVEKALQNLGCIILQEHMNTCVTERVRDGDDAVMGELMDLVKKLR